MNIIQAIQSGFRKYATFSGRASRSEYWYWTLFTTLVALGFSWMTEAAFYAMPVLDGLVHLGVSIVDFIINLVLLIPSIAVSVRRLHDINYRGWWVLLSLTIIGIIPLVIFACMRGTRGDNRFGSDPLAGQ